MAELTSKFYFVLPGKTYSAGRYKEGEVVELLEEQAEGWIGESLSKGYATKAGARKAAGHEDDAPQSVGELAEPKDAKKAAKAVEEKVSDGS